MEKRVYIAKCEEYEREKVAEAVDKVLRGFGGAEAILNGSKKVLVKPNLLMPKKPEDAATTHPYVVEAVCAAFSKAGAEVSIIDSTGGPHTKMLIRLLCGKTGIKEAAERSGAQINFDTSVKKVSYPEGKKLNKFKVLSPVLNADLVVSVAKAKTHGYMAMSGSVKNMFGTIPGLGKPGLHRKFPRREDFASMLVDICEYIKPGFNILDGIYGMEGQGPASGTPKYLGVVAGGFSPYAVDLALCHLIGMRTDSVYTITDALSRGIFFDDPDKLDWLGDDPKPLRTSFKPAIKHKADVLPRILENCVGCGDCAKVCPAKCIKIQKKLAIINEKECIRCYCCHEFCPFKAIEL